MKFGENTEHKLSDVNQRQNVLVAETEFYPPVGKAMDKDVADLFSSKETEKYYMMKPWKYITKRYLRFAGIFLVYSFFSFNFFLVPLVPLWVITLYQYYNFTRYSENVNLSSKKLIATMSVIVAIEIFVCSLLRYMLFSILFV